MKTDKYLMQLRRINKGYLKMQLKNARNAICTDREIFGEALRTIAKYDFITPREIWATGGAAVLGITASLGLAGICWVNNKPDIAAYAFVASPLLLAIGGFASYVYATKRSNTAATTLLATEDDARFNGHSIYD